MRYIGTETLDRLQPRNRLHRFRGWNTTHGRHSARYRRRPILIFASPFPHRTPLSFGEPLIRYSLVIVASWLPTSAASAAFSAFPAPTGALWPATRLIDIQLAAVELSTVQFCDRFVRISRAGHFHEGKLARL